MRLSRIRSVACLLLLCIPLTGAEPKKKDGMKPNRLAKESSPYLLQHAYNPVDWYPWGPEAFEKAKKEKKLVFLSIGYSSCHWCHVMERESFSDAEVAAILNKSFVCIKVDREERPDIDDIYMTALSVLGTRGGWPLSMFLTDDAKPIIGGTYWPKDDRKIEDNNVRGFKSILKYMLELQSEKGKELREQADEVASRVDQALNQAARGNALVDLSKELAKGPAEAIRENLDPEHGGVSNKANRFRGTKFPMPPSLFALWREARRSKDKELQAQITLTLDKMAAGGIYDHLGGGFHRYSTERTWTVPHFEKMLYDNGQLVELYAEAYRDDPKPAYRRVVEETIGFLFREMTSPQGAFYSALDADSDGKEGEFYVWTPEEIEKVLGNPQDANLFRAAYAVTGSPNFEEKAFVLKTPRPFAEVAAEQKMTAEQLEAKLVPLRKKLFDARAKRNRPFLDTKVLTAWNGQMIAGLATAALALKEPKYAQAAEKAADFILTTMRTKEGRLLRTYALTAEGKGEAKLNAYLDDYTYFVHGLLKLHDATGNAKWLDASKSLTDLMLKWHSDADRGGYFFTSSDHEKLFARPKDFSDGVQPSSNAVAASNLIRLFTKTKQESYRPLAEKTLKQFAGVLKAMPASAPGLGEALYEYLDVSAKVEPAPKVEPKKEAPKNPKNSGDVVTATATAGKIGANGSQEVVVKISITEPWHLYANPVGNEEMLASQTVAEIRANGKEIKSTATYPKGKTEKDPKGDYQIYEGEIEIRLAIEWGKGDPTPIEVRLKVQACVGGENGRCLMPVTLKVPVK